MPNVARTKGVIDINQGGKMENDVKSMELKILDLNAKGIRPADIAKIYEIPRADVWKIITAKRKAEEEAKKNKAAIEKIMAIAKVEEAIAEKVLAAVKEAIC